MEKKRVLILGIDGYIGWALGNYLLQSGNYEIAGVDDASRRRRVAEVKSESLTPISPIIGRRSELRNIPGFIDWINISLGSDQANYIRSVLKDIKPDTIIHLAEQPSAPWSMRDVNFASATQLDNVIGTLHLLWAMKAECPSAHLIKLGTMGEYGTPECDIPEGIIPGQCLSRIHVLDAGQDSTEYRKIPCPMQGLPFPRTPGSFYHLSKVHDTHNIIFSCRTWGLTATDIMQGVVFGVEFGTRFDYDQYFGTVINRFCAQAISGRPLTVYGEGNQTRGYLPLRDSIQCLTIAINKPPQPGEYRTLNQFEHIYSVNHLAALVQEVCPTPVSIAHIPNPRTEAESHYYNPAHQKLFDLGYKPSHDIRGEIEHLIEILLPYKENVKPGIILPTTTWRDGDEQGEK